jgi:cytochrome c biogenesis protein CcdA
VIVGLLALAGYVGYVLYPRFDLPAVSGTGLLVLAAAAGLGSFFSPCSFPLLVTLLSREVQPEERGQKLPRALRFGAAFAFGASVFLLLLGAGVALLGGALFVQVTFTSTAGRIIRGLIGLLLVMFGLVQLGVLSLPFHRVADVVRPLQRRQAEVRRKRPTVSFALFGFGYILAGFG